MNGLMQWLASDAWARVVQALLHTLWVGALLAFGLSAVLRRAANPFVRYRACVLALTGVLFGGLIVWAWLETEPARASGAHPAKGVEPAVAATPAVASSSDSIRASGSVPVDSALVFRSSEPVWEAPRPLGLETGIDRGWPGWH